MMQLKLTSDFSILDKGMKSLDVIVDKTLEESSESVVNRIRYNWSASSPSSPGEPPAVVTGNLDGSVEVDKTGRNSAGQFASGPNTKNWFIRVTAEYANALEYGDPSKNLAPRPYVAPALLSEQDDIGNKFELSFKGLWK